MSDEPGKRSSRVFWTTFPGVVTAVSGLIVAVTGLITALVAVGAFGGDGGGSVATAEPAATVRASVSGTTGVAPGAATSGVSAGAAGALTGQWSNETGGLFVFTRVSALAPGYEFTEYDSARSVIGGGAGVLDGTTFRIESAHNDFIGGYTGDLVVEGDRLHGTVRPDLGGSAVMIELLRTSGP